MEKNVPANIGHEKDTGLIPGSGRSPKVGNSSPLQYICLENSMDRGVWWAQSTGSQRVRHKCAYTHTHTGKFHMPLTVAKKKKKKFPFLSWHRLLLSLPVWWELPLQHTPVTSCLQMDLFWMEAISLFPTVKKQQASSTRYLWCWGRDT